MTTPINEIQTNLTTRNSTQKLLLEMGFELLEIWNKDSGEEYEIWEHKITKSRTKVNIVNKKSKIKLTRGRKVKKTGFKKAIVTLKKGQNIDLTTGI